MREWHLGPDVVRIFSTENIKVTSPPAAVRLGVRNSAGTVYSRVL